MSEPTHMTLARDFWSHKGDCNDCWSLRWRWCPLAEKIRQQCFQMPKPVLDPARVLERYEYE